MKTMVIMGYLTAIGFAVGGAIIMGIGIYRATFPTQEGAAAAIGTAIAVIPLVVAFSLDRIVQYQTPSEKGQKDQKRKKHTKITEESGEDDTDRADPAVGSRDDN